jgi:clan AA aspartic protease
MIHGTITPDYEALVGLTVRGPGGDEAEIEAVIDTGFNGFLTLPLDVITALALPRRGRRQGTLADGSHVIFDAFRVTVLWDGHPRDVVALAAEGSSVLGMSLLHGHLVTLEVVDGGQVVIAPLP